MPAVPSPSVEPVLIADTVKDASVSASVSLTKTPSDSFVTLNVVLAPVESDTSSATGVSLIPITVIVNSVFPLIVK